MKNLIIMAAILLAIIATTATAAVVCYEMHRQNPIPTREEQVAALRPLIPFAIAGQLE
nr:MAG TPA: Dr family adhesin [Caudoviricetes sp.]